MTESDNIINIPYFNIPHPDTASNCLIKLGWSDVPDMRGNPVDFITNLLKFMHERHDYPCFDPNTWYTVASEFFDNYFPDKDCSNLFYSRFGGEKKVMSDLAKLLISRTKSF